MDLKQLFIDPSENEVAILGDGYLQNFIRDGSLGNGFCVLSDKRVYFKGKCYHRIGGKFSSTKEEKTVDLKDITGVSFTKNSINIIIRLLYWIFVVVQCVLHINMYSTITDPEAFLIIGTTGLLAFIGLIMEIKSHRTYYEIQFAGGGIAFNASKYGESEMKSFQKKLMQAKDKKLAEDRVIMQSVTVATPIENRQDTSKSVVDELKNLKELLDCGAINQDEYNQCKDKILNKQASKV